MPGTDVEAELAGFIAPFPGDSGINVRSVVHAWQSGGGQVQVGKLTVRLLGGDDASFTAATIHAPRGDEKSPDLELSRVLLEQHDVDWLHWSDEFVDLKHHGFDPASRFPSVSFDDRLTAAEVARLVSGMRDLARLVAE